MTIRHAARNNDGPFNECWSATVLTTISEISGDLDPVLIFVQVGNPLAASAFQLARVGNIVGCTYLNLVIATTRKTSDGQNELWIVKTHTELATRNNVYNL